MRDVRLPSAEPQRIVLTGFMGSGKTTVGRLLAMRLGWHFADLDNLVAERHGAPVPQIFADHGEAHFRTLEQQALLEALARTELVLALGGGAVETAAVRAQLEADRGTSVVFLDAPFEMLYARCAAQALDPAAVTRPLLGSREAAAERYARRQPLYLATGRTRVPADHPDPSAVAQAVIAALKMQVPQD